jgi:asparagine synthase (glutamine-hydrolysing)
MSGIFAFVRAPAERHVPQSVVEGMAARTIHLPGHAVHVTATGQEAALGLHGFSEAGARVERFASGDSSIWIAATGIIFEPRGRGAYAGDHQGIGSAAAFAFEAYRRGGADALAALEGEFTLALWDSALSELVIANDRFGLHPHYWARTASGWALAPELKALLTIPGLTPALDPIAIGEYVRFQQFLDDRTWFEEIKVLPPATILRVRLRDGYVRFEPYWNWSRIGATGHIRLKDAAADIDELFDAAVARRLDSVPRPVVYLSGGLDSRMIVGYASRRAPVTAITYGSERSRDVVLARRIARAAGVPMLVFPLADGQWVLQHATLHMALTEGMHGWHHMHGVTTLDAAREAVDVNLTGWGGGGGTSLLAAHYLSPRSPLAIDDKPLTEEDFLNEFFRAFCDRFTWPGLTDDEAAAVLRQCNGVPLHGLAYASLRESLARSRHYPDDRRAEFYYKAQHDRRSTMSLVVMHRAAMDVRCPYFDYDLIDFVYELPRAVRVNPRLRWQIMDLRLRPLTRIPHDRDWRLPVVNPVHRAAHSLRTRAIARFNRLVYPAFPLPDTLYADYESYLRTDLRTWAQDLLLSPRALDRGLFAPDAVRALWERHLGGRELWTIGKIAPLMTIELFLRAFVD